jgi:hypothetical protein
MITTMKNLKYLFIYILLVLAVPSCVEDTAPEDAYGKGPNLASFVNASQNLSVIATGAEYEMNIPLEVKGPSLDKVQTVTATITVDPASTAVEGVHYRLDQTTVELADDNNLLGLFPVTVLTAGLEPPLAESPVLILKVSAVSGDDNVVNNGKSITLNLFYLCDSNLQGSYTVTITRDGPPSNGPWVYADVLTKTGDGQYRGTSVGHWAPGSIGGTPGFDFVDVCNVITVPEQPLVDLYSNTVTQAGESSVDPDTGVITIVYNVTFPTSTPDNRTYTAVYTPN